MARYFKVSLSPSIGLFQRPKGFDSGHAHFPEPRAHGLLPYVCYRVSELQGSIDTTMGAFDVIGSAKTPLDDTTMSMKWEVFGWPQKVKRFGMRDSTAQSDECLRFGAPPSS